jgi:hypothetical protein
MTSMVSLLPAIKPDLSQGDRIQIIAADLTDAYGRPIDGNDDGLPGGNYVALLTKKGVTTSAVAAPATMAAKAVDVLLDRGELEGLSRIRHRPAHLHSFPRGGSPRPSGVGGSRALLLTSE